MQIRIQKKQQLVVKRLIIPQKMMRIRQIRKMKKTSKLRTRQVKTRTNYKVSNRRNQRIMIARKTLISPTLKIQRSLLKDLNRSISSGLLLASCGQSSIY